MKRQVSVVQLENWINGSSGWDRTNDQLINSQLLYRRATEER